jgi:predicted nucleic acid-binding Zn ribbon protein
VDDGGQSTYELVCEHCASFAEVVSALDEAAMIRSYYTSEFSSLLGGFDGTEGK